MKPLPVIQTPAAGADIPAPTGETAALQPDAARTQALKPAILDAIRTVFDPEIPVNIVDLGLVYDLAIDRTPAGGNEVSVKMTLTAPGCGMGPSIAGDAQQKLLMLDGVEDANVEIVWDPPWHQSMITEEGRRILGLE